MAMAVEDIAAQYVTNDVLVADCNKFVQAVANKVSSEYGPKFKSLPGAFAGTADAIRARFNQAPFIKLGTDKDLATQLANDGHLVLAGLNSAEMKIYEPQATMGHVVVIAPGGPSKPLPPKGSFHGARGGYPYCYGGAHIAAYRFKHKTQVDAVFPKRSLDHIQYAYVNLKSA